MVSNPGLIQLSDEKVTLRPFRARPIVERPMLTDEELVANKGGILIYDVELFKNYYFIGFKCHKTKKYLVLESPFNERKLSWIMHNYICVGFNNIKFDNPVLWLSYKNQDIANLQQLANALINENLWHQEAQKIFDFKMYETSIRDLIEVAPLRGSLKLYMARLHAQRIQELPFPINVNLTDEEKLVAKHYNYNDLDGTELLFDFMKERIELRQAMSAEYGLDLMSKSDAQIAEAVLVQEVGKLNGSPIKRPIIAAGTIYKYDCPQFLYFQTKSMQDMLFKIKEADFVIQENGKIASPYQLEDKVQIGNIYYKIGIGGLHSYAEPSGYVSDDQNVIEDLDVTSYYPSAIINLELCPISMGSNFLTVFKGFREQRVEAKRTKNFTKDKGLKIFLNGTSGKFSDTFSKMYSPKLTIQMNLTGQLSILMLAEMMTLGGIQVISANTDGITVFYKKLEYAKVQDIVKLWEKQTNFGMESVFYSKYYSRDVNNYYAVKMGAKDLKDVKVKGTWSEVGSQSGTQLDTNPTSQICTDAVKQLLLDGTPIEDTIRNCKDFTRFITVRQAKAPGAHKDGEYAGKVIRWYYQKGEMGTINTVAANNKIPDSEGACLVMDLPTQIPFDLDYEWYERKATEILYDIAYYQRPKQLRIF